MAIDSTVVVDHGAPLGLITILPSIAAQREDARVLWGVFADELLNDELSD